MAFPPFDEIAAVPADSWNRDVLRWRAIGNSGPNPPLPVQEAVSGDLSGRLLWEGDWSGLVIRNVSFQRSNLRLVKFTHGELHDVDFSGAVLYGCDFTHCSCARVNFAGARLYSCNFSGASLVDERWSRAVICRESLGTISSRHPSIALRRRLAIVRRLCLSLGEPYSWVRRPIVTLFLRFRKL